jgi:hypothetical protein
MHDLTWTVAPPTPSSHSFNAFAFRAPILAIDTSPYQHFANTLKSVDTTQYYLSFPITSHHENSALGID